MNSLVNCGEVKGKSFASRRGVLAPSISTSLIKVKGVVIGITTRGASNSRLKQPSNRRKNLKREKAAKLLTKLRETH